MATILFFISRQTIENNVQRTFVSFPTISDQISERGGAFEFLN